METDLLICMAEEEELRTSLLEEEEDEEKERGTLEDFGGGRMEQWEDLDKFNLIKKHKGINRWLQSYKNTLYNKGTKHILKYHFTNAWVTNN